MLNEDMDNNEVRALFRQEYSAEYLEHLGAKGDYDIAELLYAAFARGIAAGRAASAPSESVARQELARLLAEVLYWRMRYEDSNPEVGFGSFPEDVLRDIAARLQVSLDDRLAAAALACYRLKRR